MLRVIYAESEIMDLNEKEIEGTLLLKYINGMATAEEQTQVDAWLSEDPANNNILLQMAQIYHAQRTRQRIRKRNPHMALQCVQQRIAQRSRRIVIRRMAVAASFLFGLLGIASLMMQNRQTEPPTQMITVNTNAGMRSHLILPDGTAVHLNAGSTLVYPSQYDKNERRVQLSGEAYFHVAHNDDQPFVVNAAGDKVNVRVTGTQFNLQAYEKDGIVQTTVIEGSVQLAIKGKKGNVSLTPSDMAIYDVSSGQLFLDKVNIAQVSAWMNDRLIFKDTPMPEVLRKLTHFFTVDFDVQDDIIRDYTFTGTFENRPLFQILDYMKISSKIEYKMAYPENQEVRKPVIYLKKLK